MATYAETDEQIRIHVGWIPLAQPVLYFPLGRTMTATLDSGQRFGPMSVPRRANLPTSYFPVFNKLKRPRLGFLDRPRFGVPYMFSKIEERLESAWNASCPKERPVLPTQLLAQNSFSSNAAKK
jgi:hypothetical protein